MSRRTWGVAAAVVLVTGVAVGAVIALTGAEQAAPVTEESPANTAVVERGSVSDVVSRYGTLTYRAGPDGSPYAVFNRAHGTYTELPAPGDKVDCGDVLYRVSDHPVLLLCGSTPAYRSLAAGDSGADVAQLNANLVQLGYATRAQIDPSSDEFGFETGAALGRLQADLGEEPTRSLHLGDAVFLPDAVRIAAVEAQLGGSARRGEPVVEATSDTLEVQVALDPSQRGAVKKGDHAQITLPNNRSVAGTVGRIGRVVQAPAGQDAGTGSPTLQAYIDLDDPDSVRRLDQAPVRVEIVTKGVKHALNVPVTAIVGTGDGFAVQVVRADGRRESVAVELGLFDTAGGRVAVQGALRVGDRVVVPSA